VWGYTAPSQSIAWGLFPLASSWIASHLWTQYRYTQDKDFLKNVAYPLLKSNAIFLLDFMIEDHRNGYLLTGPCISPENWFRYKGAGLCASMMPTGDRVLAFEILNSYQQAAKILGIDQSFANKAKTALTKLPPLKIGKSGALQEWYEDYEEAQPNHRHTMHLLSLYPYSQISPDSMPKLAAAAAKTIESRLNAQGWEDTEWSRANFLCYYARLKDAARAYDNLQGLYKVFARNNLFCVAPAGVAGANVDIFEFDANQAAPAGIAEMLVQNCNGYIELLPALPPQWQKGYYKGLCVEGGGEVDVQWQNGKVQHAVLRATANNSFVIKHPTTNETIRIYLRKGDVFEIQ
jgi:alpha-L-fucosidase 2